MPDAAIPLPRLDLASAKVGVIGLGYVGLPLAVAFGKRRPTVGFDIDPGRIAELGRGEDRTREVEPHELGEAEHLTYAADLDALRDCTVFVVTVPTPIDEHKQPDLRPLRAASETVGQVLKRGDVVIYESTVYPGATEEECVPVLERVSGLQLDVDFHAGYSPERINPGDRARRLPDIVKVTSGSTPEASRFVDGLYGEIIAAGTHRASSIKVAEAAKVIENTQRDLNIALVNELALIFHRLGIDTLDVLEAAGTKWNFLPFRPGLVGGHCIGVDPYYLTHRAAAAGYYPEVVLAGRRINDGMGAYVAQMLVKAMVAADRKVKGSRVLVLGLTFKENCPDLRNTRVVDVIEELRGWGVTVDVHDPWVDAEEARHEYGLTMAEPEPGAYDAVVLAVAHREFAQMGAAGLRRWGNDGAILLDVKGVLPAGEADLRL